MLRNGDLRTKVLFATITIVLLVSLSNPAHGGVGDQGDKWYSFDTDRDRIDDRFDGFMGFPTGAFAHLGIPTDGKSVGRSIEATGSQFVISYTIVEAAYVIVPDRASLLSLADLDMVEVIEMPTFPEGFLDVSSPAVRAKASERYSPMTAQDLGYSGKGITIAVIDSGVDNEHQTFRDAFVAGVDFTLPDTPLTPRDGSFDPDDVGGHGTAVASIALGRGDEEGRYSGVAPGAGLIDLKVMGPLGTSVRDPAANMVEALQWCVDNSGTSWGDHQGVDVVTISLAIGPVDGTLSMAVAETARSGIAVVLAAGNSGNDYPSQTQTSWPDGAIIVGGIDDMGTVDRSDDAAWGTSTRGPRTDDGDGNPYDELRPDVVAPAVGITYAMFSRTSTIQGANSWTEGSGTSFAAPHVSGTIAMMLEANPDLRSAGTKEPVRLVLHGSSEAKGTSYDELLSDGYNGEYGWGCLDAYEAVRVSRSFTGANSPPRILSIDASPDPAPPSSNVEIRVRASDPDEEALTYTLSSGVGTISGDGPVFIWRTPTTPGNYTLGAEVKDPSGSSSRSETTIQVLQGAQNVPPLISSFKASPTTVDLGGISTLTTVARDPDDDVLTYSYSAEMGTVEGEGEEVIYTAPDEIVDARVTVTVTDGRGGEARRDLVISVRDIGQNSGPIVVLVELTPSTFDASEGPNELIVRAQVEDPDGPEDITSVVCDLSELGLTASASMSDDGSDADLLEGDGVYSLRVEDLPGLEPGDHTITVVATDSSGTTSSAKAYLRVTSSAPGPVTIGSSDNIDPAMIIFAVLIIATLAVSGVMFFVMRGRSARSEYVINRSASRPQAQQTGQGQRPPVFRPVPPSGR